ncbi:hypothetical protein [Microbispora sp. CA-102843]|uniref:hypothetical protein n=1 Tax=Microbispora sp. CA-102843 TaxID=3239952 RepID=UPI003D8C296A
MTGPENYAQAEALLESAARERIGSTQERYLLAAAQVRATLALAAATALNDHEHVGDDVSVGGLPIEDWKAWREVAGVKGGEGQ